MSLQTLTGIKEIDGFQVLNESLHLRKNPNDRTPHGINPNVLRMLKEKTFIHVKDSTNEISLTIQHGPVKQFGINGIRIETIIHLAIAVLKMLDRKYPSPHNKAAIVCFESGIKCLKNRHEDREDRGVQGHNKP